MKKLLLTTILSLACIFANAKDIRIRRIEPVLSAGAFHIQEDMKDFIEELDSYPISSSKDLLDIAGWFLKLEGITLMDILDYEVPKSTENFQISFQEVLDSVPKGDKEKALPYKNYPQGFGPQSTFDGEGNFY